MAQEIERKFLVIGEFKSSAFAQSHIVQGYISSARGRTVRVRIRDDKGYLTIKELLMLPVPVVMNGKRSWPYQKQKN